MARGWEELLQVVPDALLVLDPRARIAHANARLGSLFDYRPADLDGASLDVLLADRSREAAAARVAEVARSDPGTPAVRFEAAGIRKDGSELPIAMTMSAARVADEPFVVASVRDVSDELAVRHAAGEREQRVAAIYATVSDVLFQLDVEEGGRYRFVSVNERFCAVTGLRPGQVLGKYVDQVIPEPSLRLVEERYAEAIRTKKSVRWEEVSEYPTGRLVGEVCVTAVFDEDGRCKHLVGSVHDVTAVASDRMAAMGTLAAGIAHEINNPLAVVVANLEIVASEPGLSDDARKRLADARDYAWRIRTIVRDLKLFSRADEERRGPVDPELVLESTLRMAANEIRHRARLVRQYDKVPFVLANESRLAQVFLNILVNAAQAIPEGKADVNEIRVTTRVGAAGEVVVEIADTGSGMTPEVRRRLFTPFFSTKPVGEGTGLGLSISRQIVTSLGGSIEVESEVGKGSLFRVRLSRAAETASTSSEPPVVVGAAHRRGRVLVVDDEQALTGVIEQALSDAHDTVVTTRARGALARIEAGERFDVILCDLMMPDMTGMDLYDALSRGVPDQAERVVFMTGGAFTTRAREFLDRVKNPRVEKPFDTRHLLSVVNSMIR
jgi:PAS domain S-box-containing protein